MDLFNSTRDISRLTNGAWRLIRDSGSCYEVRCNNEYTTTISALLYRVAPDDVLDAMDHMYLSYKNGS